MMNKLKDFLVEWHEGILAPFYYLGFLFLYNYVSLWLHDEAAALYPIGRYVDMLSVPSRYYIVVLIGTLGFRINTPQLFKAIFGDRSAGKLRMNITKDNHFQTLWLALFSYALHLVIAALVSLK
jgi:hypothetical protein